MGSEKAPVSTAELSERAEELKKSFEAEFGPIAWQ
jgi:hypothetical protein